MAVIGLVKKDVPPSWSADSCYFGLVVDEQVAMHKRFVLGDNHPGYKFTTKMLFYPFVLFQYSMTVGVQC